MIHIMDDFEKIVKDFTKDLLLSFPELKDTLHDDIINTVTTNSEHKQESLQRIFDHCKKI